MNQKNGRTDPGPLRERARSLFISQATIDETLEWATPRQLDAIDRMLTTVFCQVVIGQCGVSFPSEKAVGFSPVRNWPVIARVLLFHCIRA